MKSRIKAMISDEVSKRKGRHKRSSSCPVQNQINQNSPIRHLEPIDESDVQMNEDNTARSSPNVQESMATSPNTCDLCAAMGTVNYLRQSEVNYKGKRPVKDDTYLEDKSFYAIDHRRAATLEESRLFLDALDLLNMRKELFLNVLRDPSSSLAQQLHEKRSSRSRERLSRSLSFPCTRVFEPKDVNRKHEGHYLTQGDTKSLYETKNSCLYSPAGEQNDQSMPRDVCSDEATPELPQRQPNPTGNVPPVSPRHLNTRKDKVVIKRFKNLGDKIRHAIKEGRKERQHIIKDGVLDKIPHGKKSQGYNGQVDTSEKPPKIHMKTNLGQKCFKRASTFNDSVEKYNRLLDSDANRQAKGKEPDTLKLRTNVTPLPIKSIPKRLNRIYSSPDLEFYRGLQIEEALDSTRCKPSITSIFVDPTSSEGIVISGKQPSSESSPSTENHSQMDKISKCESKENSLDVGEVLDAISKSENIENACKDVDRISKCGSQENFVDAGELLDKRSTFECQENIEDLDSISKCQSQENFEDAIECSDKIPECSDKIPKCESQGNIVDSGVGLNKISLCEGQENIVDAGLNRISECESFKNSVDAGDSSDRISKCDGRENMEDDDEGLDRILKCESRQNIVDVGAGLDRISRCDSAENIEDVDEGLDRTSKCEAGENYVNAGFGDAGDLTRRTSESSIDLVADKSNSSYQEDDPDPAKYNLQGIQVIYLFIYNLSA
ncbi:hypothetical protein Leryth_000037 [Lithospermum erythrorhizon]|nr:hypothetical protein Leryth_000037 [Lithospermum erythrorhizon]